MEKTIVISQTSPQHTGSTVLVNLLYGFFSPAEAAQWNTEIMTIGEVKEIIALNIDAAEAGSLQAQGQVIQAQAEVDRLENHEREEFGATREELFRLCPPDFSMLPEDELKRRTTSVSGDSIILNKNHDLQGARWLLENPDHSSHDKMAYFFVMSQRNLFPNNNKRRGEYGYKILGKEFLQRQGTIKRLRSKGNSNRVLVFQFEDLLSHSSYTPEISISTEEMAANCFYKLKNFLPPELFTNETAMIQAASDRIKGMNELYETIKLEPLTYRDKFYGLHGSHRQRDH